MSILISKKEERSSLIEEEKEVPQVASEHQLIRYGQLSNKSMELEVSERGAENFQDEKILDEHFNKEFGIKWRARISEAFSFLEELKTLISRFSDTELNNEDMIQEYCNEASSWDFFSH